MAVQQHDEREGALLRRLKSTAHTTSRGGPFGFVTAEQERRRRPLVVVARIIQSSSLAADARAAIEAGADAVEFALRNPDTSTLSEVLRTVKAPCGIFITAGDANWSAGAAIEGLDWIHVAPPSPAALLATKGVTRLISLPPDLPANRLPGLSGLAEVVVVDDPSGTTFSVDTLLALRTIQGASKAPVLAGTGLGLTPDGVAALQDSGVDGVLVTSGTAAIREFVSAIEALP